MLFFLFFNYIGFVNCINNHHPCKTFKLRNSSHYQPCIYVCLTNKETNITVLIDLVISQYVLTLFTYVFSNNDEDHLKSIFTKCENSQGFRLKENVQFHLYISTSPCGDARIFSPHESGVEGKWLKRKETTTSNL